MSSRGKRVARLPLRARLSPTLRSGRVRAVLGLGVVAVLGFTGNTFAFWTDSVSVAGTTFTAGTIDLKVNDSDAPAAVTTLTITNMVPGNTVAGLLTVKNAGTAPLKYSVATTATNPDSKALRDQLAIKLTSANAVTGTSPAATCGGTTYFSATTLNTSLSGSNRLLAAAGGNETLCVQVSLSASAPTTVQGGTSVVQLVFTGTSDLT